MGKMMTEDEAWALAEQFEKEVPVFGKGLGFLTKRTLAERGMTKAQIADVEAKIQAGEIEHDGMIDHLLLKLGLQPVNPPLVITITDDLVSANYLRTKASYQHTTVEHIVGDLVRQSLGISEAQDAEMAAQALV